MKILAGAASEHSDNAVSNVGLIGKGAQTRIAKAKIEKTIFFFGCAGRWRNHKRCNETQQSRFHCFL